MTTLNKSDLQKCAEQSGLQVDGRSEFAYTDRLEQFSRLIRLDLELEITYLRDQLAKAGQRVAKWQPISTAPKDAFVLLAGPSGYTTIKTVFTTGRMCSDYHKGRWIDHANDDLTDWGFEPTHWMPLPKAPNGASS